MIIKTDKKDIIVASVISTSISENGKTYPALKFVFNGAVSEEDISELTSGYFSIGDYIHTGYSTLGEISVVVGKITTAEQKVTELESEMAEVNDAIEIILPVLDDKTAVKVKKLYDEWEPNKAYESGVRVLYGGILYKVREGQGHTSQVGWEPNLTPALWVAIDETHEGTLDDPIPAIAGMQYEKDKYYIYNDVVYLCVREDSEDGTVLQFTPDQLIGNYFEVV